MANVCNLLRPRQSDNLFFLLKNICPSWLIVQQYSWAWWRTRICASMNKVIVGSRHGAWCSAPPHFWHMIYLALTRKLRWQFKENTNKYLQENAVENVVCRMWTTLLGSNVLNMYLRSHMWLSFGATSIIIYWQRNAHIAFFISKGERYHHSHTQSHTENKYAFLMKLIVTETTEMSQIKLMLIDSGIKCKCHGSETFCFDRTIFWSRTMIYLTGERV